MTSFGRKTCSDKVRIKAKLLDAWTVWGALAGMKINTPDTRAISVPSKLRLPLPSTTEITALRVEVCSLISVPAAKQNKLHWLLLSLVRALLLIPLAGYWHWTLKRRNLHNLYC